MEPFLKGDSGRNTRGLLRLIILCTIAAAAVSSRLFSVIRESSDHRNAVPATWSMLTYASSSGFESIIHECSFPAARLQLHQLSTSKLTPLISTKSAIQTDLTFS